MTQVHGLLEKRSYQSKVTLTPECLKELRWWISQLKDWNGKAIINAGPDIIISSDASKIGWGAALGSQKIQGQWTRFEHVHNFIYDACFTTTIHQTVLRLEGMYQITPS